MRAWSRALCVALVVLTAACTGSEPSSETTSVAEVRIGLLAPLSGPDKAIGTDSERGAQLAAALLSGDEGEVSLAGIGSGGLSRLGRPKVTIISANTGSDAGGDRRPGGEGGQPAGDRRAGRRAGRRLPRRRDQLGQPALGAAPGAVRERRRLGRLPDRERPRLVLPHRPDRPDPGRVVLLDPWHGQRPEEPAGAEDRHPQRHRPAGQERRRADPDPGRAGRLPGHRGGQLHPRTSGTWRRR